MTVQNSGQSFINGQETVGAPKAGPKLPPDVAHNYILEMLVEMSGLAVGAQLKDLEALLNVTIKAVEINGRFL